MAPLMPNPMVRIAKQIPKSSVKNPIMPSARAGIPKPMTSNNFAAIGIFKYLLDNSQSDNVPNTTLIINAVKWGKALYKPFYFHQKTREFVLLKQYSRAQ